MSGISRPHILLINTHDSGRFFGCYGVKTVRTPHIDGIAGEGVLFENMMAASPICSPSRGAMVTGRWPQRNGLLGLTHHGFRLNEGERHMAALFREGGYATALFHFQHVAAKEAWADVGFDAFLARSRDDEEPVYPKMARPAAEVGSAFAAYLETRDAGKPFFAQINFNETHTPFDFGGVEPERVHGVTVPPWVEPDPQAEAHFAHLQGAVQALDKGVGIVLDALRRHGLDENTVVLFATDHGLEGARDKWTCYEPGLGIAALVRWPAGGVAGARRIAAPVSNVDILPTLLDLAGLPQPDNLDGISLAPILRGEAVADPERPVFGIYHNSGIRSVRISAWKLIRNFAAEPYAEIPPATLANRKPLHPRPPVELYDLAADPHEFKNLATEHPEKVRALDRPLAEWMRAVNDPILPQ
ncbi:MAG: sulfatase [Opitutales bacterium]|nr:sulfatase [Opitutales bacterium]